jgi:hypothetical protein
MWVPSTSTTLWLGSTTGRPAWRIWHACLHRNQHKGPNIAGRDPETGEIVQLFHHRWGEHFD